MTPTLRKRAGGVEEIVAQAMARVKALAATQAKNKGIPKTRLYEKLSSATVRDKRGVATVRDKRGGGQGSKNKKAQSKHNMLTFDDLFGSRSEYKPVPGDDTDEDDVPDEKTKIDTALAIRENCKIESEEAFERLNAFLERNNFSADQPYKHVMLKLSRREAIDREVREEICKYIQLKLRHVQQFLCLLAAVHDWEDTVAGYIVDIINEVTEHLGVGVTELKDISLKAERILDEPEMGFKLAKAEYVKDCVRSWCANTNGFRRIAEEWVDNPTAIFSSCDRGTYDRALQRRTRTLS